MSLLIASGVLVLVMVALLVAGESTLPVFSGDRALAARIYECLFLFLAGMAFSLAVPAMVRAFVGRARTVFSRFDARGRVADALLGDSAPRWAGLVGFGVMGVLAVATVVATVLVCGGGG